MNFYYDTDPYNSSGFLQNGWGRLVAVEYFASPSNTCTTSDQSNGIRFIERYSYTAAGLITKKRFYTRKTSSWPTSPYTGSVTDKYMEAAYTYDNEGKTVSVTYPGDRETSLVGRKYTYTFDSLGRPIKLTDDQQYPVDWAKEALYNPAGQMTQLKYYKYIFQYFTETRSYNNLGQVTQIQSNYGGVDSLNMQYVYSATQNNGQISQTIDSVSGETIDFTYDSLNRLITAATQGPQWGLSFSYDGFGNRWSQTVTKGSGPSSSLSVNAANNRITTSWYSYYPNGNLGMLYYGTGLMYLSYDIENRLMEATNSNGTERYAYGPDNRRVYQKKADGSEWVFFYGVNGDRLGTLQLTANDGFLFLYVNIYFAGRMIIGDNAPVHLDRLGSVRNTSRYYPFGEEQGSGSIPQKFATYYRDTSTGWDYAQNRYYSSTTGRFTTPDPYGGSASLTNPQSWNRYTYVNNDPVNSSDPEGLDPIYIPPIGPVDKPQCISSFIPAITSLGAASVSDYFNSSIGVLGVTLFFENQGNPLFSIGADPDLDPTMRSWLGMGWALINRFKLPLRDKARYGFSSGSLSDVIMQASDVWDKGGKKLTLGWENRLIDILSGSPESSDCEGLAKALGTALRLIQTGLGIILSPGALPAPNPVDDATFFAARGKIPSTLFPKVEVTTIDGIKFWRIVDPARQRRASTGYDAQMRGRMIQ